MVGVTADGVESESNVPSARESSPALARTLTRWSLDFEVGSTNLRYEHLKQLAGRNSSPAEMEFVRFIAEVLTRFANADIPPQVALYYASLRNSTC